MGENKIKIKRKFLGFSEIIVSDRILQGVFCSYCAGKNRIWEMFFGWRKSSLNTSGIETMTFLIPTKDIDYLFDMAQEIKNKIKD